LERIGLEQLLPIKGDKRLSDDAVILGHVAHRLMPAFEGAGRAFLEMIVAGTTVRREALWIRVLSMANGIVKVELGGKVKSMVTCVLAADVVPMKGEKWLIRRHSERAASKEVHRKGALY
jgi:hypothetical protein